MCINYKIQCIHSVGFYGEAKKVFVEQVFEIRFHFMSYFSAYVDLDSQTEILFLKTHLPENRLSSTDTVGEML